MEPSQVQSILLSSPTFVGFSEDEVGVIAAAGEVVHVPDGLELIREGESGHAAYLVLGGSADVSKKGPDTGQSFHLATVEAGQILGEVGLLLAQPAHAAPVALKGSDS